LTTENLEGMAEENRTRRAFLKAAGAGALSLAAVQGAQGRALANTRELLVYVGTYTNGGGEGVYLYRLSLADGSLKHVATAGGVANPSYLALDRERRRLYAVEELEDFGGAKSGAVAAFEVGATDGSLRFINRQPSTGGAPCYITTDTRGRFVLVANYAAGSVAVLPVTKGGALGPATDVQQHSGSGPDRERQEGPHAHCIILDASNKHAYACDLGTDKVMIYDFDARRGKLKPNAQPFVSVRPGAGPRHLTFDRTGRFAYVVNEMASTVTAFSRDASTGALRELETHALLPDDFKGANTAADIHLTPDGRFLYCSNRGHDSIACFRVDAHTGSLAPAGHTPTLGSTPRNFAIDPTGGFMLVANQKSGSIVTFRIDASNGALAPTGRTAELPSPVCLKLAAPFG
jgi:6-phosphogluconolactonase